MWSCTSSRARRPSSNICPPLQAQALLHCGIFPSDRLSPSCAQLVLLCHPHSRTRGSRDPGPTSNPLTWRRRGDPIGTPCRCTARRPHPGGKNPMKLVRFGAPGAEKPGLIDAQGGVRDLSAHVKDITGDTLSPASLDKLRKIDPKSLPSAPQGRAPRGPGRRRAQFPRRSASTMPTTPRRPGMPIPPSPSSSPRCPIAWSAPTTT